jgi:myo-inositol catabolism protein IolC
MTPLGFDRPLDRFAVGRTVLWDPRDAWRARKATREAPAAEIAHRCPGLADLYEGARPAR